MIYRHQKANQSGSKIDEIEKNKTFQMNWKLEI